MSATWGREEPESQPHERDALLEAPRWQWYGIWIVAGVGWIVCILRQLEGWGT